MKNTYEGKTFADICNIEKNHIRHALKGELPILQDDGSFIFATADKKDCEEFILDAYDEVVFHAQNAMYCGQAMEEVAETNGLNFSERIKELQEKVDKLSENNKYKFESIVAQEEGNV